MSGSEFEIAWEPAKAKANLTKHGVRFSQAATVLTDPLALTVFDAAHSRDEERWFTLGTSAEGRLLAVAHTFRQTGSKTALVRIISAREASRQERRQYETQPRWVITMNDNLDEEMPDEIDFSKGVRGKFYRPDMKLALPVYLDNDVQSRLSNLATAKGVDISDLVNDLLKKDLELIEAAT